MLKRQRASRHFFSRLHREPPTIRTSVPFSIMILAAALSALVGVASAASPEFCGAMDEVLGSGSDSFRAYRGRYNSALGGWESRKRLPDASDCFIQRNEYDVSFYCEWEYRDASEQAARAAANDLIAASQECLEGRVRRTARRERAGRLGRSTNMQSTTLYLDAGLNIEVSSRRYTSPQTNESKWIVDLSVSRSR